MSARIGLAPEVSAFSFYINGGLDKRRLDKTYIETLKFLAQVHQHLGDTNSTIMLTATFLHKQLQTQNFSLKDWCQDCIELSHHFL